MVENNIYNKPIYTQDGLGIFFGPTFGQFYINDLVTNEGFFKDQNIVTLEDAKRKLAEALRNKFKKLRVMIITVGFGEKIMETNAVFYSKNYEGETVHVLDDVPSNSIFKPRSWSYNINFVYPATEENRTKVKTMELYEEQMKQLRDMIWDIKKSMKPYTLDQLKKEAYIGEEKQND